MIFETVLTREQIDRARADRRWPDRLLNDDLQAAAAATPERVALTDARGSCTYVELAAAVDEVALGLLEVGVRPQDVVSVQLPNWNEFVILTLALERIGAVVNPIATIFRGREVGAILDLARPVGVVTAAEFRGFDFPAMYEQLWEGRSLHFGVVVGGEGGGRWLAWEALRQLGRNRVDLRPQLDWLRPDPNQVTELIFTSGTTGQPKGVLHTANTLGAAALSTIAGQRLGPDDVFHMASTFAHQTGFVYGVRLPIHCGAPAVYQDVWDAGRFVELVGRHGITFTMGATPYVVDLLRALGADVSPLASLRTFISAGAPIPEPVAEEMAARLSSCRLAPGWGMSENNLVTSVFPEDPPEKVVSSDGRPFPGMEVQVRTEAGPAAPGEEGDLYARGPFTFVGYVQGRAFTEPYFDAEGWFATGDRARIDADGFIRITGRTKDLIIRGGENLPVKEIEDLILRHPSVRQVALVAVPDERLGERACACVVLEEGAFLDLEGLRAFLRERQVTPQFWPERLVVMSEFPTTPSGKVQKFRLRELVGVR